MKPKKFINDPSNAVDEFIAGLLLQYPNHLRKLANHPVLLHSSFAVAAGDDAAHPNTQRVSLLSGGGSGHEPSHAGYIGTNMLSGAILGGIFASPPISNILAAIRAVTIPTSRGGKGCLLIVKNYTGDRLNFGMACELANAEGLAVKMVVVADDCAIERQKGITGARGVAGTVLVHKAAGGAAGKGMDLDAVSNAAETVANGVGSLGVALEAVTIPGADQVNDRLSKTNEKGELMMEIGLGIHGEAGMRQCSLLTCDEIAKEMLKAIQGYGKEVDSKIVPLYKSGDELLVLINNLGGTSNFEMSLLARSLVSQLEKDAGCKATRVLVGSFMTAFDMQGASVSIMPLTGDARDVLSLIDADTDAPAWTKVDIWADGASRPSDTEIAEVPGVASTSDDTATASLPPVLIDNFSDVARSILAQCSKALIEAEPILTKYDTIVGDGDCGITMERGAKEISKQLESGKLRLDHPSLMFSDLADAVSASMGGTSGILLELMFRKASTSLLTTTGEGITSKELATAFRAGVEAVSFYGGAQEGSRTMLDALFPASAAMLSAVNVQEAALAARTGADATAAMDHAEAGRSNYLSKEVLMGTPDPGAVAVAIVLEAMAPVL
eukprot:CAMPEP_0172299810 /NCGR_PEP_ID=MMETSP1058-20130122/2015_1 /TAXON_ID=83371 /ORGANISM="Detonula confervacea, Strain CCMP 353" /LENGTH=611 /DNA_ID=CAMNT_0013009373 /DNA_START=155 /DNA_END=1990 /DNA_ORIENTATION=+